MEGVIKVNRIGDKISGSVNGVPFSVSYSEGKFKVMRELEDKSKNAQTLQELKYIVEQFKLLTIDNYGDFVQTKSPYIKVNKDTNKFHLQYNGVISNKVMPDRLSSKIIHAVERSVDILPLVKCWVRFLHCPNYSDSKAIKFVDYMSAPFVNQDQVRLLMSEKGLSEVMAIEFSTTNQVAITQEGLLVGYKASAEITERFRDQKLLAPADNTRVDVETGLVLYDETKYDESRIFEPPVQHQNGDAFLCGTYLGHIMKVGQVIKLPRWDQVNTNDNDSGVKGLHVGGLNYIRGYQSVGTVTHNIFIDPMHIGAIVGLGTGNDGAMRVKQYFMYNAFNGVNKQLYHSSSYAAWTDEEYGKMVKDAVDQKFVGY